jgi:hypothetical protein
MMEAIVPSPFKINFNRSSSFSEFSRSYIDESEQLYSDSQARSWRIILLPATLVREGMGRSPNHAKR